jgi:hypothetical protein
MRITFCGALLVACSVAFSRPAAQDAGPFARLFTADALPQQAALPPPEPSRTGLKALMAKTGGDFKAFPRRKSTWVLLGIGAAGAGLAHPADDDVNARLAASKDVGRFFAPGKWIGSV